ncbi:hypothetical protein JB92DRAFT_2993959 [Gautieria morchelliformis]|nr:hypothetical protein JB92DRAFT_2993959 [Gautieria morchelliformis]
MAQFRRRLFSGPCMVITSILGCFTLAFSWRFRRYFHDVFEAFSENALEKRELQKRRRRPFRRVFDRIFHGVFQAIESSLTCII